MFWGKKMLLCYKVNIEAIKNILKQLALLTTLKSKAFAILCIIFLLKYVHQPKYWNKSLITLIVYKQITIIIGF